MPDFDAVSREHVLQALAEYDERGAKDFLATYGFGPARDYVLWHDGKGYDSKAILGVAMKYATGVAARRTQFRGGKDRVAKVLRALDFHVSEPADDGPAGGVAAAPTPRLAATRARPRRATPVRREAGTCPTCHMQLPATGVCDTCG